MDNLQKRKIQSKEIISGVYLITNIANNKMYVGSSNNIGIRFTSHKSLLKNNKHHNRYLQAAYNKYGKDCFIFTIIATCPQEYLAKLEQWFINSLKPEYNISRDTESFMRGQKFSQEHINKIQKTRRENGAYEKTLKALHSSIKPYRILTENQIKELHRIKKEKHTTIKRVAMYSLDNELLKVFESTVEAAKEFNVTYKAIWAACKDKSKKVKGFYWKFQNG